MSTLAAVLLLAGGCYRDQPVEGAGPAATAPLILAEHTTSPMAGAADQHAEPRADGAGDATPQPRRDPDGVRPIPVSKPPFSYQLVKPVALAATRTPALALLRRRPNNLNGATAWRRAHDLRNGRLRAEPGGRGLTGYPSGISNALGELKLVEEFVHSNHRLLSFGRGREGGFLLTLQDHAGDTRRAFDLTTFRMAPQTLRGDESFVDQLVIWAEARDGVLYVATGHRTRARSSFGNNAYITALDLDSGEMLWRSAPLVANAGNFVLHGSHILSAYGFNAEDNVLYALDRRTGETVKRVPLASIPVALAEKGGLLFVHSHDSDDVFRL